MQIVPRSPDEMGGVGPCSVVWVPPLCALVAYYATRPGSRPSGTGGVGQVRVSVSTQTLGKYATWCRVGVAATATATGEQGYQTG